MHQTKNICKHSPELCQRETSNPCSSYILKVSHIEHNSWLKVLKFCQRERMDGTIMATLLLLLFLPFLPLSTSLFFFSTAFPITPLLTLVKDAKIFNCSCHVKWWYWMLRNLDCFLHWRGFLQQPVHYVGLAEVLENQEGPPEIWAVSSYRRWGWSEIIVIWRKLGGNQGESSATWRCPKGRAALWRLSQGVILRKGCPLSGFLQARNDISGEDNSK